MRDIDHIKNWYGITKDDIERTSSYVDIDETQLQFLIESEN